MEMCFEGKMKRKIIYGVLLYVCLFVFGHTLNVHGIRQRGFIKRFFFFLKK